MKPIVARLNKKLGIDIQEYIDYHNSNCEVSISDKTEKYYWSDEESIELKFMLFRTLN